MPLAEVNGQQLFYEDSEEGDDVIVFSHGFLMDHTMFDSQVDALADDWRVITWDERGHGQTVATEEDFTYWDSAKDLLGLLDHLEVERAVLGGMSQGGFLSLRAALTAPERVRGLVLLDTQAGPEPPEKIPGYDQLVASWDAPDGPPQPVLDIIAGLILGADWEGTPRWQDAWREVTGPRVHQIYRTLVRREDLTERLGEIACPALVVHGAQDASIAPEVGEDLADGLGDAEFVLVADAGHAANLTHPEPVNAAIEEFLARL